LSRDSLVITGFAYPDLKDGACAKELRVKMCDATPVAIEVRILEVAQPGCYFAWHEFSRDTLAFIYPSDELVRMCDPGGFEPAIARGEGQIVPVRISAFTG
jgi:hypothetical protein